MPESAVLKVYSDDPVRPLLGVPLSAEATAPPAGAAVVVVAHGDGAATDGLYTADVTGGPVGGPTRVVDAADHAHPVSGVPARFYHPATTADLTTAYVKVETDRPDESDTHGELWAFDLTDPDPSSTLAVVDYLAAETAATRQADADPSLGPLSLDAGRGRLWFRSYGGGSGNAHPGYVEPGAPTPEFTPLLAFTGTATDPRPYYPTYDPWADAVWATAVGQPAIGQPQETWVYRLDPATGAEVARTRGVTGLPFVGAPRVTVGPSHLFLHLSGGTYRVAKSALTEDATPAATDVSVGGSSDYYGAYSPTLARVLLLSSLDGSTPQVVSFLPDGSDDREEVPDVAWPWGMALADTNAP